MLAFNFYLGLNCTSRKEFEFVSGNLAGPALRKIHKREVLKDSRIKPFIDCSKQMVKESNIRFIKERIGGVKGPNYFSAGLDATKLVKGVHLSEQNQYIVDDAYPDNCFFCLRIKCGGSG